MIDVINIPPLQKLCITIGQLPASYLASMTFEEQLLWLCNYLEKTVIPAIDNNAEALQEVQELFNMLKSYVDNYFDNLDVQDEINNKLDEMTEDGTLQNLLLNYVNVQKIYDTTTEMLADNNLMAGQKIKTLGYYNINDNGGSTFVITSQQNANFFQIPTSNNLYATLIIEKTMYLRQFGAKGDGVTDDSTIINNVLQFAFNKLNKLIINKGTYLINSQLNFYGTNTLDNPSMVLEGEERDACTIKVNSQMNAIINILSESNHVRNIIIKNLHLNGNSNANIGINCPQVVSESLFENIKIENCINYGFLSDNKNFYLNRLNKIYVYECENGFNIYGGTNTSLNIENCYCYNAKNAYKISGIYNTMINCCADGQKTENVFDFSLFRGTAIGCGSEAYKAKKMFIGGNRTNVVIIGAYTWGNDTDEDAVHVDNGNGTMTFLGGKILFDRHETGTTMPGKLYEKSPYGAVNFINTLYSKYAKKPTYSGQTAISVADLISNSHGLAQLRYSNHISYVGSDGSNSGGYIDNNNIEEPTPSNAIYFGLGDSVNTRCDDKNLVNFRRNFKGDILLSRNPENIGGIGWIQSVTTETGTWRNGTYFKIPVVYAETSANRIPNAIRGQMMFDKTLGKPIWYNGTNWVDANGTVQPNPEPTT